MKKNIKKHVRAILFFIGIMGIFMLAQKANPEGLDWRELFTPKLPFLILGLMVIWAVIYIIHATAFRLIIGEESSRISRAELYRICISGFALNNVTPAGLVGGEPYRIMELSNYMTAEKATLSTVTFSLMYMMGHVLLWLSGAVIYFCMGCPGDSFINVILIISSIILTAVCLYFFAFKHKALTAPFFSILSKCPLIGRKVVRYAERNAEKLAYIDRCYEEFYTDKGLIGEIMLLEYSSRLLEGVEYMLIFLYLGVNIHLIGGVLVLSLASLIGNIFFVVPMQAGTREGGTAIALDILGVSMATGLMGSLIYRIRDLICTVIGIALILVGGNETTRPAKAAREK